MKSTIRFFAVAVLVALLCATAMATQVTFQLNMKVQVSLGTFSPATDSVFVRGSFQAPPWAGYENKLTDANNDTVYTGTWDIPASAIEYKFVLVHSGSDTWENIANNRTATVGTDPLVIPEVYFNDQAPAPLTNVEVNFRVNMSVQTLTGAFNPASDWVVVRGGHDSLGQWGGAVRLTEETGNPGVYSRWIEFPNVAEGTAIQYKYVRLTGGDPNVANWESNDNRTFTPTGNEPDVLPPPNGNGFGEITPDVVYFSNVGPNDIITHDLNVVFQVNIRSLYGKIRNRGYVIDVQTGTDTVRTVDNIDIAGFFNAWPWGNFSADHVANDLGQNGDFAAGDSIWSRSILFPAGSPRNMIYKYGANMYDVEGSFAVNHSINLDDSQPTMMMPIDCWGSQPDTLYTDWLGLCVLAADDHPTVPNVYRLDQNYPNPFNPTTMINFALPKDEIATIRVYDLMGRTVTTLLNAKMNAGEHSITFDASKLATGMYFYRLEAGSFQQTRKLLLLK